MIDATTGSPIEGATVSLNPTLTTLTDVDGMQRFNNVSASRILADFTVDIKSGTVPLDVQFTSSFEIEPNVLTISKDSFIDFVDDFIIVVNSESETF